MLSRAAGELLRQLGAVVNGDFNLVPLSPCQKENGVVSERKKCERDESCESRAKTKHESDQEIIVRI